MGRYAAADVKSFLRGVVSGRVPTAPLRAPLAAPSGGDCGAVHAAKFAPAEEDSLDDDFMVLPSAQLFLNSGFGTAQTEALDTPARSRVDDLWRDGIGTFAN